MAFRHNLVVHTWYRTDIPCEGGEETETSTANDGLAKDNIVETVDEHVVKHFG